MEAAVALATRGDRVAAILRPLLRQLDRILSKLPLESLPPPLRDPLQNLAKRVRNALDPPPGALHPALQSQGIHAHGDYSFPGAENIAGRYDVPAPLDTSGLRTASRLNPYELATGRRLEAMLGKTLRESAHEGADFVDDFGQAYDALGTPRASLFWNEKEFVNSILGHLRAPDNITAIDLTGFTADQIAAVERYLATLSPDKLARIIRIGF